MPTSTWGVTFEDSLKQVLGYGSTVASAQLTRQLNAPAELSLELAINGQDTEALLTQYEFGAVYARLAEGSTTRFFGVLTDLQITAGDSASVSATFMDLAQQYAGSFMYRAAAGSTYVPRVLSGTHNTIIDAILNTSDVLLPLTRSGSVSLTRTIATSGMSRLEVLDNLASLAAGIDWFVTPDQTLKIGEGNTIGTNRSKTVRFQYGDSTATALSATVQYLPPRNRVWFSGNNETATVSATTSASTTSQGNYGMYAVLAQAVESGSENESDFYSAQERAFPRRVVEFVLEPSVCPRPWTNFDLGDIVGFDLFTDATTISTNQVVSGIAIELNDQLVESSITVSTEVF